MEKPISLEQFQEMALKVKYFKCNECGKSFSQLEDIVSHLETHKKKKVKENFICHECSAVLDSIDALMKHLETHEKTGNRSTSKTTELVPIISDLLQNNNSFVNEMNTAEKATAPSEKTPKQNQTKTGKATVIMKQNIEPSSSDVFKSEPKYLKVKECFICQECSAMFESTELLTNHEKEQHKKTDNALPFRASEQIPIITHSSPSETKAVGKVVTLQESRAQPKIPKNSVKPNVETKRNGQQSNIVTPKSESKQKHNRTVQQCPYCPKNFLSKGILAIHTKRWHASEASVKKDVTLVDNNKNYSCCECSERFSTIEELVLHLQSHVKNKSATVVPNCNSIEPVPNENLMKTIGKKNKKAKLRRSTVYPCEFCSGVFGYADDLEKHLKVHSEGNLDSTSAHLENELNDSYIGIPTNDDSYDKSCSDKLPNRESTLSVNDDTSTIDKRLTDEDVNISLSCDDRQCGSDDSVQIPSNISFTLTEKDKLTSEIQTPVDTITPKESDPTSLLNGLADAHAEESRSQDLFELSIKDDSVTNSEYHFCECKFCNEKFSTVASFKTHLVQAHSNIPSKYGCSHCPFFSSTTAELEIHMEEHKHTCQLCCQIFEGSREFIKHLRSHTTRKTHKCKICLMAFASIDEYELHLPKCTKHKFVCRHCSADFSCRKTFVHHLFKHTGSEPYLCQTPCSKSFATLEELNAHQISDCELHVIPPEESAENTSLSSRPARQECPFCSATFAFFHNLKVHLRTHTGERPYVCEHCSEGFITSSQLTVHLRTHTGEKPFQCHHCAESFHYHSALANHLTNHNVEKTFQCEKCTKTFYSEESLQNHMKKHDKEKKHECSICFKTFHQMRNLSAHIRVHTGERPFVCSFCDKAFVQKSHLTNHVRIHTQEKPYLCLTCGKSFRTHSSLINHKSVHDKRDYICEICGRICKSVTALRFHQRLHKANKELKYQCEHCDQNFAYQFKLNVHLNAHTGNKPYKCPFCPKQFAFPSNLYTHKKRMHFMDRPHQCKECNKGFFTPRELSKHMVTHREGNNGSDFACDVCEKVFMTYSSLKLHSRKHSARNTFVCQYCPRTFSSSHNLLSHERSHTGERPFRCLKCTKAFSTSSILSKHMKKDHPEEDADADMKAVETITTKEEIPQENMLFTIGNIVTDSEGNQYPIEVTEAIVRQLESEIQFPTNVIFITEPTQ